MEQNISNFIPGVIGINALALMGPAQSRLEIEVSAPPQSHPSRKSLDDPSERPWHLTLGNKSGSGKGHLHSQLSALSVNFFARILLVDLVVKRPEHGTAFSSQLFLKSFV
jgi:hypothetical protein